MANFIYIRPYGLTCNAFICAALIHHDEESIDLHLRTDFIAASQVVLNDDWGRPESLDGLSCKKINDARFDRYESSMVQEVNGVIKMTNIVEKPNRLLI